MTSFEIAPRAQSDLDDVVDKLNVDAGPTVALRYGSEFKMAFVRLTEFPRIGAPRPKFDRRTLFILGHLEK